MTKRDFFVVHDYGMGGLWGIILARSPEEIRNRYKGLTVFVDRPAWLNDEDEASIRRTPGIQDIDDEPKGFYKRFARDKKNS